MRKKLAMLMASLFLVLGTAWAQVAYTVDATTGGGVTSNGWSKNWSYTTTAEKPAALKLLCNAANMQTRDNLLALYVGTTSPATYTLQVPNKYHIVSYSFDFVKDGEYTNDVTLTVNGKEYKPTSETQSVSVENVNASSTSFVFSGANKGIKVSNFVVNIVVAPIELTTDVNNPKWYTIKNVRGNAYARYDGDGEAIKLYGNIVDRAFLFYFTAGNTEGTYKIHNAANDLLCAGTNSWTETGAEWYIKTSGNSEYPGFAISTNADLTQNVAWNDYQNAHTSVAVYNGNDAGSTWDVVRYEGEIPAIQLSTEGNIVLHYIRSIRRDSYVNFAGHNVAFDEGAQGLMSYWYFVEDTEAPAIDGFIACKIFNAAHATGVEDHGKGFMGTNDWPAKTFYIGFKENDRYGYIIRRGDLNDGGWHDYSGDYVGNYGLGDNGSLWRIYPAGKTGADLMSEATTAKNNALSTIALYESADYYTYSDEAIATAKTAIEAVNTAELPSAVAGITSIPAAMTTLQATEKGAAGPVAGDYIRFMNRAKGVYMAATENDGDMIRKSDDATDLKTLWLVEAGENGSVKLKNVATQKYIGAIARSADVKQKESAEASQFTFTNVADVYGAFQTTGDGDYTFANMNEWWGTFKLVGWEKNDNASQWVMSQAYPLTVVYQFEGAELTDLRVEQFVEPGTVYTIENSDAFDGKTIKTVVGATDNGDGTWAVTVNAATTVTVTLGYEDTDLYVLKSVTLGTNEDKDKEGDTYLNFTPVTTWGTTTEVSFQSAPSYLYITKENEAYVLQSLVKEEVYVGSTHGWNVTTEKSSWDISEADENGYVTISRHEGTGSDGGKNLGNDTSTKEGTGIFSNVQDACNKWQLIPAYPITIIYKNSDDEVLETIKAAAIVGTEYSFHIDTKGGELASCETDKGTIQVTDGTCTLDAVYGATTVTISIAPLGAVENPAAVVALVNRIGGVGTANSFKFVHDPALNLDGETFVIGAEDGKILIKGSTLSALTTGLGWYLNNIAHINIAWNSLNEKTTTVRWDENAGYADLSHLPIPTTEETHTSDAKYRYYLNYCTFGYSMTSWTWTRWQQEIDWMALHGINMPLQIIGLEEVWRKFLTLEENGQRKYNYSDSEAKAFVAGPAFTAWWGMNNLEGWGGTSADGWGGVQDDAWYERQQTLATQILTLQRALGMQPVLPGFSGMVPSNFKDKTGVECNAGSWGGFTRPKIVLPSNARFAEIAADYYACLKEVMGESQYYSMDPFHEGDEANASKEAYTAIYNAMETAKSGSQWVIQQWQWYGGNQTYSLQGVPAGKLIVLDLFSDGRPEFDKYGYNGYAPQEAVFCAIPNFGGRSGLMGRLQNVTDNYFKYKKQFTTIKGIGAAPEAIEQTPVAYDLLYQLPWMNGVKPDVAEWVDNYAVSRYGKDNAVVKEAWSLLRQGPLNYGADAIQGPVEDVWAARPNLDANPASSWGKTLNTAGSTYTPARRQMLIDAVYKLIDQEDELELANGSVYKSNYMYDLVEFGGAVMADYAYDLLLGIKAAKNAEGTNGATYKARRDAFLQLILDMDAFRGTNLNFRLGKWTQEARDAASEVKNATSATPDWYEFNNARTIITTWGDQSQNSGLKDYSYRSWQGLLKDYYYPRWEYYFNNNCTGTDYFFFEWNWAHGMTHKVGDTQKSTTRLAEGATGYSYSREPEGNTVEEAVKMLGKYIIPVVMADGTHYAYRYLTNDLSSKVTIIAMGGTTIDLTKYFGALEGATVTGEFIDGEVTDLANIAVKSDLTKEAYTGTITLADGTVLTFGVSANPKYNGAYQIKYSGDPVFIQYHNVGDNAGNVGYKVVTTKIGNGSATNYSADYEADKIFTIVPSGTGYTLSAQGQYLKTTVTGTNWHHIMFSDQKGDAGTYVFTEAEGLVKLKSTNSGMASVAIFDNGAWGNDVDNKAIGFSIEEVENYAITVPASGYFGICLPFNVVLPTGMTAYDVTVENLTCGEDGAITSLDTIAVENQTLKAGTPALLKATAGNYNLAITMDNTDAKTSSPESKLRGNFVKQTLQPGTHGINKYVFENGAFTLLDAEKEIPANTCWLEAKIDAESVDVTEQQGKILKIDDWLFKYEVSENGSITLVDAAVPGTGDLVIGSYYTVNGKTQRVSAISPNFLHENKELKTITLPATLTNLGFREVQHMFSGKYEGQPGDGVNDVVNPVTGKTEKQGLNRCFVFPNDANGQPYKVSGNFAWKLTLDVTIDSDTVNFNGFGSSIVSTLPNSLADYYTKNMQIYMHKGHKNIVVKIDNNDDRYLYKTKVVDAEGNETDEDLVMTHFKFELEHDGAGGYQVVIYYENGHAKMYNISSSQQGTLVEFDRLYYSLPEGVHVDVSFDALISEGLFVGCTNLKEIKVDSANPTFKSCEHGVLYDKNGYYVMRIPEGGDDYYSIPSKVVKLYQGAIHGVKADIVLHSNPQIGVVKGHEQDVKNAKFYLSLDDIDATITEGEKGYGGARDFTSGNANTYLAARYKRKPLAEGKFGTFMLPFVPENALNKYDFFELKAVSDGTLTFTQVSKLKAKTPYIYRLKENPTESADLTGDKVFGTDESGNDVFETSTTFTVEALDKFAANQTPGKIIPLGAYVNGDVETEKYKNSNYYLYQSSTGMFHRVTKKLTYRPYRAFFVWNPEQGQAAPAKLSLRLLDGSTTEIDPSQIEGWEESVYYDLQGRRVLNPTNGVYIVNGKKVIVE